MKYYNHIHLIQHLLGYEVPYFDESLEEKLIRQFKDKKKTAHLRKSVVLPMRKENTFSIISIVSIDYLVQLISGKDDQLIVDHKYFHSRQ
jgi:ribosomal protein L1